MPRKLFPSGRKSLLLLVLAVAMVGGAWWWAQPLPPPEPVHDGHRISEWVFTVQWDLEQSGIDLKNGIDPDTARAHLPDFGPAGVAWLAWQVEHGRDLLIPDHPLPFDGWPDGVRRWIPERWGGLRNAPPVDERAMAAYALSLLGPRAASAIPALVKGLNGGNRNVLAASAWALQSMEGASWPTVREAMEHAGVSVRLALVNDMASRLGADDAPAPDAEMALVAEACVKACGDAEPPVREAATWVIRDCRRRRPGTARFDVAIPTLIGLLSDSRLEVRAGAAAALGEFGPAAAPAIDRLIELLDDPSSDVRWKAIDSLRSVDKQGKRSAPHVRLLLNDPEVVLRDLAAKVLEEFADSPEEQDAHSPP